MEISMICEKCGKVHTDTTDGCHLVVDFKMKHMTFICQNKKCKHDNIFDFGDWGEKSKRSPLPQTRVF